MTGAGQSGRWPNGTRSAVVVTVNVDGDRSILASDPQFEGLTKTLSTARYGIRHGVDNLLTVFEEYRITASWFLPGLVAEAHPAVAATVGEAGGDLAMRGWDVEPLDGLDPDQVGERLDRAVRAFADAHGPPTGFRLPRGQWPSGLVDALLARGLSWSSSFVAADLPFLVPGASGCLVELPFHWAMDDRQAFAWNFAPAIPAGHSRIAGYDDVLATWVEELRGTHDEGGLWTLSLHPEIMATPGRLVVLRDMLAELRSHDDIWITTGSAAAAWWAANVHANPTEHPLDVFLGVTNRSHL